MSASLPLPGSSRKACGRPVRIRCDAATENRDTRCTRLRSRRHPRARCPWAAAGSSSISARWHGRRSRGSASGAGSTPRTPIPQRRASACTSTYSSPASRNGYYHAEAAQEGFLVLSGECIAIIENEERRMRRWDYFHSPPGNGAHHGRRRRRRRARYLMFGSPDPEPQRSTGSPTRPRPSTARASRRRPATTPRPTASYPSPYAYEHRAHSVARPRREDDVDCPLGARLLCLPGAPGGIDEEGANGAVVRRPELDSNQRPTP